MPGNPRCILAPSDMRTLLSAHNDAALAPIYYEWRMTPGPASRFQLPPGADLSQVEVLWMGGAAAPTATELTALLAALPRLAWIYTQRAGVDHVPLDVIRASGVPLSNGAGLTSIWVAEMGVACVCAHAKGLPAHERMQRRHGFTHLPSRGFDTMTVLALGTGIISAESARMLRAVGMSVIGASRRPDRYAGEAFNDLVSLPDALATTIASADALIVGIPLEKDTTGLISADVLLRMKSDAVLVNLARPRIVDEHALVDALRAGALGAAYVARLDTLNRWERWRAERLPNLHLTHNSEHNVAARVKNTFDQFIALEKRQRIGEIGNRVL